MIRRSALLASFILFALSAISQDTIPVKKVMVANTLINPKTNKIVRVWYRKVTVKKGYIIKLAGGTYVINGREMKPDNFSYNVKKGK